MLVVPLSQHARGTYPSGTHAVVELDDDGGHTVSLTIDSEPGETFDDRPVTRYLTPLEARSLAAVLVHFATEAER